MLSLAKTLHWFHPKNLFGMRGKVGGLEYFVIGIVLASIKYVVEMSVIGITTNEWYSPLDFVNPFLSGREKFLSIGPGWLGWGWLIWTFPFFAVCVLLSVRRCVDANVSPWISFITLIPILNLAGMPFLAAMPSRDAPNFEVNPYSVAIEVTDVEMERQPTPDWEAGSIGLISGAGYFVLTVVFCVYIVGSYGTALFFGAPVVTCAASAYWLNRRIQVSIGKTIGHSILILLIASMAFLLIGIEGGICILMAMPLFIPLAILGALIGYSIASVENPTRHRRTGMFGCLAALPVLAIAETLSQENPVLEVRSEIVVNASIGDVWNQVIAFPDIQSEPRGLFAWGVAYPIRATIDGHGVGAVRHCEFTTGTFVEPITGWDEPYRLAFDVTSQPEPMSELSPYHSIHPPHLNRSFRSLCGEFRLIENLDGTTRLQGSTWYQLDIGPRIYWKLWTDQIVHRIHERVLDHIRSECESKTE
ncbi:MAG: hypothetical protein SGI77_27960 [Pirellulaceae bacterium]|nr:hypothetical protein [Pirellulaceae bacterium]